jgi:RNA polymerase sigma factor (sigma-70 family)
MQSTDDGALLRQYSENHSDEAFAALVTRHINLVYSVALRQVGNLHQAEEITQAVFIILAKKAASLRHEKALSSWLFQVARLTANNFIRSESRRRHREEEAYMQSVLDEAGTEVWPRIASLLDDAVAKLREKDRQAIVLRFYEGRNLRDVGLALGATEAAAEKRVSRALEKLRKFFTKRGVSSTTAILAGAISANSVQAAPVALAKGVTTVAIVKGSIAAVSTSTLVKGTMKTMTWLKIKFAIVIGTAVLLAGGMATVAISQTSASNTITLNDGTKLTLLGVTTGIQQMAPGYENLRTANRLYTPNKPSMLWIKSENASNQSSTYEIVVYDKAKTACVNLEKSTGSHVSAGVDIQGFILEAFPRWDKEFIVRVRPYRGKFSQGQFIVSNPAPVTEVTNWIADPLPATKSDGNLEVTLAKLVAGATTPSWAGGSLMPTNDPVNQCVHLNFDFRQNGQSTTNWDPWPVQTTDAAGNWSRGLIYDYPTNGVRRIWGRMINGANIPPPEHYGMDGYYYQPGLWPDKPWKVRLEFIQRSGFSDDEMVTFTNVPVKSGTKQDMDDEWSAWDVGKTNFPFTITSATVKGVHLKLLPPLMFTNVNSTGNPKDVSIIIGADPDFNPKGMNLTVVSATDDQGRDLWHPFGVPWAGHYSIEIARVDDDVKSVNLTLALHKSRFVEFTVNPSRK